MLSICVFKTKICWVWALTKTFLWMFFFKCLCWFMLFGKRTSVSNLCVFKGICGRPYIATYFILPTLLMLMEANIFVPEASASFCYSPKKSKNFLNIKIKIYINITIRNAVQLWYTSIQLYSFGVDFFQGKASSTYLAHAKFKCYLTSVSVHFGRVSQICWEALNATSFLGAF